MIENQVERMVQETSYRLSYQGLRLEDYLKYTGQTMDAFKDGYKAQATEIVKSQLVIEKIIEVEKVEALDEEVEEAQDKPVPDVKKNMHARQLDYIKNEIIIKKLFDLLKNENKIN